jgi:hypothetical protein
MTRLSVLAVYVDNEEDGGLQSLDAEDKTII